MSEAATTEWAQASAFEIQQAKQENLRTNFPRYEIVLHGTDVAQSLGSNFAQIMTQVAQMPDTFGLCGALAATASGLVQQPENWKHAIFSPDKLKKLFNTQMLTGQGPKGWTYFLRKFEAYIRGKLAYISVSHEAQFHHMLSVIHQHPDIGILAAFWCHYPEHGGYHSHWLAVKPEPEQGTVVLLGDLSPFGLEAVAIRVPSSDFVLASSRIIGAQPNTTLERQLNKTDQQYHLRGARNTLAYNIALIQFASQI